MPSDYEKYIQQQAKERDEFFKKYPEEYEKQKIQRQQRFMELKAKRELAKQRLKNGGKIRILCSNELSTVEILGWFEEVLPGIGTVLNGIDLD